MHSNNYVNLQHQVRKRREKRCVGFADGHAEFVAVQGGNTEAGRKSFWEKTYGSDPDNNQWHIKPGK